MNRKHRNHEQVISEGFVRVAEKMVTPGIKVKGQVKPFSDGESSVDIAFYREGFRAVFLELKYEEKRTELEKQLDNERRGRPILDTLPCINGEDKNYVLGGVLIPQRLEYLDVTLSELDDILRNILDWQYWLHLPDESFGSRDDVRFPRSKTGILCGSTESLIKLVLASMIPEKENIDAVKNLRDNIKDKVVTYIRTSESNTLQGQVETLFHDAKTFEDACCKLGTFIVLGFIHQQILSNEGIKIQTADGEKYIPALSDYEEIRMVRQPCKVDYEPPEDAIFGETLTLDHVFAQPTKYEKRDKLFLRRSISEEVWETWELLIENKILISVFQPAVKYLRVLRQNADTCYHVLRELWEAAKKVADIDLPRFNEIIAEATQGFQKIVQDRKQNKAYYTLPESATFLASGMCYDVGSVDSLKSADFACGTGSLLHAHHKLVLQLGQFQGVNPKVLHKHRLENNVTGMDITHESVLLTLTGLMSQYPDVALEKADILAAAYGFGDHCEENPESPNEHHHYGVRTGALELLGNRSMLPSESHALSRLLTGQSIEKIDMMVRYLRGSFDHIMGNPPFHIHGADNNSADPSDGKKKKSVFAAENRSEAIKQKMLARLRGFSTQYAHGQDAYSHFLELYHRQLDSDGRLGIILPITFLTSVDLSKVRKLLATQYHNVVVVAIAEGLLAFSADSTPAECVIWADKGVVDGNTGRAKVVTLNKRPDSHLLAQTLAELIQRQPTVRRLEDGIVGGDEIKLGDDKFGTMLDCPIYEGEWVGARLITMEIAQVERQLREGNLQLSATAESHPIPTCRLGDIASFGKHQHVIKGKNGHGAFDCQIRKSSELGTGEEPAIWKVNAASQRSIRALPNAGLRMMPSKEEKAKGVMSRNSQTHYHMNLSFSANSVLAHWTDTEVIGVSSITNVKLDDPRYAAAWTLWTNSTLGMLAHLITTGNQQKGRGRTGLRGLSNITTLDVRRLRDEQLKAADNILAELKSARFRTYQESVSDPWRHILDARLFSEVLGITNERTHRELQDLRRLLCNEPIVAGDKKEICCFMKDRKKAATNGWDYIHDDAAEMKALEEQKVLLVESGIRLSTQYWNMDNYVKYVPLI